MNDVLLLNILNTSMTLLLSSILYNVFFSNDKFAGKVLCRKDGSNSTDGRGMIERWKKHYDEHRNDARTQAQRMTTTEETTTPHTY